MKISKTTIPSILVMILFFLAASSLVAQNPIVPAGVYIADPSAHTWKDGKLYVYGSRDESPDYYCSWDHHVLSTSDMINWEITEYAFSSRGENDQVPYSDVVLFAPDCQYRNGTYYLYYCLSSVEFTEGVATSKYPNGPFVNGKNIDLGGFNQIDPAVFIDDDGQGYYIWGQFTAKMAKLKLNMIEIDTTTIKDNIVTEKEHFFHEGGYLVKRNGIYYFIYAHMGRANRPTCIGYATSDSPMGPYKYGGVIVDNDYSDPSVWNNHGSIAEFNNQWYVFYHRPTHNSAAMRKACVEPIFFNEDGSIDEVEMTTQGAGSPLKATSRIDAERACLLYGNVRIQAYDTDKEELAEIYNNDNAAYKYIDFGDGVKTFSVRVLPGKKPGKVDVTIGQPWRPSICTVDVPGNGDGKTWITLSGKVKEVSGVKAVWLRFYGEGVDLFSVDWFEFDN